VFENKILRKVFGLQKVK